MRPLTKLAPGQARDSFSSISELAKFVKDYWFLITVLLSAIASIFYMAVFQVTPLDKYYEIRDRRERVQFHTSIGKSLLEQGYYAQARTEFQMALDLQPIDDEAMSGRYLADLFLQIQSPDWNPAVGSVTEQALQGSRVWKKQQFRHIVEEYRADVASRTSTFDAEQHYRKALELKPDYIDALFRYGWFIYSDRSHPPTDVSHVSSMKSYFEKITKIAPYDYRGFHGRGYALYMQAIADPDPVKREKMEEDAVSDMLQAWKLRDSLLNLPVDLGEVARSTHPSLSAYVHESALQIEDDPKIANLPDNTGVIGVRPLTSDGEEVFLVSAVNKRAWITYQLALDYLALCDLGRANQMEHDRRVHEARGLDRDGRVFPIYVDQSRILQMLLPGASCKPYQDKASANQERR